VDFVERGFRRFCKKNGADEAKEIWSGFLRIMDHPFELTEQERNSTEKEIPHHALLGRRVRLRCLNSNRRNLDPFGMRTRNFLPAAFYKIFAHNLWKWMRVYDYSDAA